MNQIRDRTESQLAHQRGSVGFRRLDRDAQNAGYLLVTFSLRQELKDFTLPRRERIKTLSTWSTFWHKLEIAFQNHPGDPRSEVGPALVQRLYGRHQIPLGI